MLEAIDPHLTLAIGAALGGGVALFCVSLWSLQARRKRKDWSHSDLEPSSGQNESDRRNPDADHPSTEVDMRALATAALLSGLPVPAFLKDITGTYRSANPAFGTWFELGNLDVVGKSDRGIFPTDFASHMIAGDREVFAHGSANSEEIDVTLPSGSARTVDIIRFPDRRDGEIKGLFGLIIDTTAHTLDKLDLSESKHQAELANRSKSEFLANMSHELRTPLNAIIGFSEMIKTEMLGPVGQPSYVEYSRDIHESATHLLGLINDILDLSKIEAGSEELAEEAVLLPDLVTAVITLVKSRAHKGGIRLTTDIVEPAPVLYVDKRKVKQILVNLLTNAIKFTPEGGQVTLRGVGDDASGDFIFQVIDTGLGMAEEDIPRALTPFSQLDRQLSRKHEGTGLGLPLTKRMVEMHFGSLTVVSSVGEGTTITVQFPATRVGWPDQENTALDISRAEPVFGNT